MLGVVSGSNKETVHTIINAFFPNTFQVIIDGEATRISKPSPEPYLIAVKQLGVPAEECLVIENAPLGVQSAKNAGLRCIAVATYLDRQYLKDADMIAENHKDIGKCINIAEQNGRKKGY